MRVLSAVAVIIAILVGVFLVFVGIIIFNGLNKSSPTPQKENEIKTQRKTANSKPQVEVIAKNLEVPWALAFLPASPAGGPNGDLLVTERIGRVRLIKNGSLEEKPVATINVKQTGESGLHGIAVHPKYPSEPFIFLYYTYQAANNNSLNRVVRFTFNGGLFKNEEILVDKIPGAIFHDGGRIKFGRDGYLYIATGDAQNPSLSQDKNSLAGKILRVTDEGKPAPGNPFGTAVYSYGHRNPQGITWDNQGNLWETEHGSSATDEVNMVKQGKNYGWPTITGEQTQAGMETPVLQSGSDTWAPAGIAFLNGSLFFAGLRGQTLFEVNTQSLQLKEHFKEQFGRIRDVILGPDHMLYITTSNRDGRGLPSNEDDRIIRINPQILPPR